MKRSDFIKKVLKSDENTVFVSEEQVANSLEIFISLGMIPPNQYACTNEFRFEWEDEDEA